MEAESARRRSVPRWRDVPVPALLAVVATVEAATYSGPKVGLAIALEVAACAVLVLRRRATLVACSTALALLVCTSYLGPAADELAAPIPIIALTAFSLARYTADLRGLLPLALSAVAILAVIGQTDEPPDITDVVFIGALLSPPYALGLLMRALARRNEQLIAQATELLRLQAQVKQDAVIAERARIARELHDVIAHSVSAMVVQASAAEDLVRADPDRATHAVRDVADTGRRALAETGRLLHLIRDTDDELGLSPEAGLARLEELVEHFRRSGLDVELSVDGSLADLPAGVDLSGYRIVQEALTNALKYAADRAARVRVRRSPTSLDIDAENLGVPGGSSGSGLGLVGMAERVHVFGGQLTHGFTDDDLFVLSARLPVREVEA